MAQVDPADDTRERFVVWRYRYDPERRQRRDVVEVAFDAEEEFQAYLDQAAVRLASEKEAGRAEACERYWGTHLEPGHRDRMSRKRQGTRRIFR